MKTVYDLKNNSVGFQAGGLVCLYNLAVYFAVCDRAVCTQV